MNIAAVKRRRIEEALEESAKREAALIENAVDVICSIDAEGKFVTASPASSNVFGYEPSELIGRQFADFIVPDDVARSNEAAARIIGGQPETDFENRYLHKNGSIVHVLWSATWSESEQLMFCIAHNITDRKIAEEAMQRMASIVESSDDAIISKTLDGIVTSWNSGAQRVFGYTADEMVGQHIFKLFPPELTGDEANIIAKIKRGERFEHFETVRVSKDGRHIPVSLTVSPIKDKDGNILGVSKIVRDITERKIAEEKLEKFARELERSNLELQDFAAVASHDLQEPLRKIQSFADELKSSLGESMGEDDRDTMERMVAAAGRMRTLINDLLSYSRITTQAKPFVPVDLASIVPEVLSDLEARTKDTGGQFEVGHLPTIDADPMQMRQLFQNLIGNGLKFHRPGVAPIIKITSVNGGPNCQLTFADNGIGFDEKYLDRIFTVFQRLHGRNEFEGTGVGLAICRKIVERHGGEITANSTPGSGATFTVTLPIKQPNEGQNER